MPCCQITKLRLLKNRTTIKCKLLIKPEASEIKSLLSFCGKITIRLCINVFISPFCIVPIVRASGATAERCAEPSAFKKSNSSQTSPGEEREIGRKISPYSCFVLFILQSREVIFNSHPFFPSRRRSTGCKYLHLPPLCVVFRPAATHRRIRQQYYLPKFQLQLD